MIQDFKMWSQKKNLVLGLIQENLIEFQKQSIYFIYTKLVVCATLYLTYYKDYMLSIKSIYGKHAI